MQTLVDPTTDSQPNTSTLPPKLPGPQAVAPIGGQSPVPPPTQPSLTGGQTAGLGSTPNTPTVQPAPAVSDPLAFSAGAPAAPIPPVGGNTAPVIPQASPSLPGPSPIPTATDIGGSAMVPKQAVSLGTPLTPSSAMPGNATSTDGGFTPVAPALNPTLNPTLNSPTTNAPQSFFGRPVTIPSSYAGESTATPGYAQDAASDAAVNAMGSNVNASDDAMAAVTKAAGTAAQVFGNHDGTAGIVTTINGTPTRLTYDPQAGTFSDGSTTYTADQVKQFASGAGLGGVQQQVDTPVGGQPAPPTQADVDKAMPGSILAGNSPISLPGPQAIAPVGGNTAPLPPAANPNLPNGGANNGPSVTPPPLQATDQGGNAIAPKTGLSSLLGGLPATAGPTLTPTTPANALTNSTISPGPGTDRYKIAQDELTNWQTANAPQLQANLRDAERAAAATGSLGSGSLNTSLGNAANQFNLQEETQGNQFLSDALKGSIQDAYNNIGIAQQQQGFQAQQQGTAFNQGVTQTQVQSALQSTAFNQALQQFLAGTSGDPTQTMQQLSQMFSNQSADAGKALSTLVQGINQAQASGASSSTMQTLLQQYLNSMKNAPSGNSGSNPTDGGQATDPTGADTP